MARAILMSVVQSGKRKENGKYNKNKPVPGNHFLFLCLLFVQFKKLTNLRRLHDYLLLTTIDRQLSEPVLHEEGLPYLLR